ncbi:hypothetical protein LTR86_007082 [Recurvomyces mirabilis]|nr:hypothetical protein LTR86_007082 [Recurvomyces mirabilis]
MARFNTINALFFGLFTLLGTFLYSNRGSLMTLYANRPGSLKEYNILPSAGVEFEDIVRSCEDVYMNTNEGWAILSCDPGRASWNTVMGTFIDSSAHPDAGLYIYHYQDQVNAVPIKLKFSNFASGERNFHPLGIEYIPQSRTLYVVNHAPNGPRIESFRITVDHQEALHIGTIEHPELRTPNSIAALSPSSLLVTNDHYFEIRKSGVLAKLETYLALPLANVVRLDLDISRKAGPPKVTQLARLAFANGVALLNATTMAVSSSAGAAVHVYSSPSRFMKDADDVKLSNIIRLPFLPDNLSVDSNGALLIAGAPYAPALEAVSKASADFDKPDAVQADRPKAPSWIAEWTEKDGLNDLFVGYDFSTSTTAVRDSGRGIGLAVGLYERGIMTWGDATAA